jgi:hypothetical protein
MDNIKFINFLSSGVGYVYHSLNDNSNSQILDPLTTVIRLAILSFKPVGTKISINLNKIEYQEPNILQGTFRWSNGDKRSDLHNLCNPLKICRTKYIPDEDERVSNIYSKAIHGLVKLQSLYDENSDSTSHALSHYINILNGFKFKIDQEQLEIYNKFSKVWTDNDIDIINDILVEIENKSKKQEDFECYLNSIDAILNGKDTEIKKVLNNTFTGKV